MRKGTAIVFFISVLILIGSVIGFGTRTVNNAETVPETIYKLPAGSQAELYKDMFVSLLSPYISQEIQKHYGKPYAVAPFDVNFLEITRPYGYRSFVFRVKIEVHPYTGAHNTVGTDYITFLIPSGPTDQVKVEKFEHIKTYRLPPYL